MNWGANLRLRNEYFKDLLTLNPRANLAEQDYFRFRGRVWTTITPLDDLSLNARLATETQGVDETGGLLAAQRPGWHGLDGGHH